MFQAADPDAQNASHTVWCHVKCVYSERAVHVLVTVRLCVPWARVHARVSRVCPGSPGVFLPVTVPGSPGVFEPVTVCPPCVRVCA